MIEFLVELAHIALLIVALKAITVGSDFDFVLWLKYRSKYVNWYRNRPSYPIEKEENRVF